MGDLAVPRAFGRAIRVCRVRRVVYEANSLQLPVVGFRGEGKSRELRVETRSYAAREGKEWSGTSNASEPQSVCC